MKDTKTTIKNAKKAPRTISWTLPQLRPPKPTAHIRSLLIAIVFVFVSILSGFVGARIESGNDLGLNTTSLSGQKKIVTGESQLISKIAKDLSPSVVSVNVSITTQTSNAFSFFGYDVGGGEQQQQGAGTGVIISSKGIIMTNRHVVPEGTTNVTVTLSDGTELKDVTVIGRTASNDSLDVAFLKVNDAEGHTLVPAAIGDSGSLAVGDNVVAIGNALGQFQNTVTSGIISGFGRSIVASDGSDNSSESLADLIQTDAAINSGNSGGPLVNLNGQVIGINTAIAGNAQNIGFALPINNLKGLISQVLKTGKFVRPYLGVHYLTLTAAAAYQLNLPVTKGAYIAPTEDGSASILEGSPAAKAGLEEKDIITEIDGEAIDQTHSLIGLLSQHAVGDKVNLTVIRGDQTKKIEATLEAAPSS